jgi:3-phenylpropionate/trans-cinnamate dioxygenase ferredoxin reductase subunit
MSTKCELVVNGKRISARIGDTILEAALIGRIVIPHDCNTGQCETCRVRVYAGKVDDQGTGRGDTVLACQATVAGEAVVEFDEAPRPAKRSGTVVSVAKLTPDIFEVALRLDKALTYLPGQYVKVSFAGYPVRDYSPTLPPDGVTDLNTLLFHIRMEPDGVVSSDLGRRISAGTRVSIQGPFGNSFHRRGVGRIILVSSGTGFAPIWAVARASRFREPEREMIVIAGARYAHNLYMREAMAWLARTGVERLVLTCSGDNHQPDVRAGRPTAHLPKLNASDTVFTAGAPAMVAAVELLAEAAGATCYADAFLPAEISRPWRQRLVTLVRNQFRSDPALRSLRPDPSQNDLF